VSSDSVVRHGETNFYGAAGVEQMYLLLINWQTL
jgi:hypothetical protein